MTVADWPLESRVFWHLLRAGYSSRAEAQGLWLAQRAEVIPDYDRVRAVEWEAALSRLDELETAGRG